MEQPDFPRRRFCGTLGGLLAGVAAMLIAPQVLAWPTSRGWLLADWLAAQFPGVQFWECEGINGRGIWSIRQLGIDNGLCHIRINGNLVLGQEANVDQIFIMPPFNPFDRPVKIIRL